MNRNIKHSIITFSFIATLSTNIFTNKPVTSEILSNIVNDISNQEHPIELNNKRISNFNNYVYKINNQVSIQDSDTLAVTSSNEDILIEDTGIEKNTNTILDSDSLLVSKLDAATFSNAEFIDVPQISNPTKTWMSYTSITSIHTKQYELQQEAYTDEYGFRKVGDRYCVAIGSYFNINVGDKFTIILENGTIIPAIMGDEKSDDHTDSNHIYTVDTRCCTEFIVDSQIFMQAGKYTGDCSKCFDEWNSPVIQILKEF